MTQTPLGVCDAISSPAFHYQGVGKYAKVFCKSLRNCLHSQKDIYEILKFKMQALK